MFQQTKVSIRNRADWKLSGLVDIIFYASAITLVLDQQGQPFEASGVYGFFRYGMLLPSKKFKTGNSPSAAGPVRERQAGVPTERTILVAGRTVSELPTSYSGILAYRRSTSPGSGLPIIRRSSIAELPERVLTWYARSSTARFARGTSRCRDWSIPCPTSPRGQSPTSTTPS